MERWRGESQRAREGEGRGRGGGGAGVGLLAWERAPPQPCAPEAESHRQIKVATSFHENVLQSRRLLHRLLLVTHCRLEVAEQPVDEAEIAVSSHLALAVVGRVREVEYRSVQRECAMCVAELQLHLLSWAHARTLRRTQAHSGALRRKHGKHQHSSAAIKGHHPSQSRAIITCARSDEAQSRASSPARDRTRRVLAIWSALRPRAASPSPAAARPRAPDEGGNPEVLSGSPMHDVLIRDMS